MNGLLIWQFIQSKLQQSKNIMLLVVVESIGSSPGRMGFTLAIANDDDFEGTIGGGIMEFKLVEKAKSLLKQNHNTIFLQEQFHDKEHIKNQSGMICSGSQKIAFVPLFEKDLLYIQSINNQTNKSFILTPTGFAVGNEQINEWSFESDANWRYSQAIFKQPVIHIIGGGHCGLALSQLMKFLDFYIHVYDDRENLNTLEQNIYANEKHLVNYENINQYLNQNSSDYVVIMTIGYRTDKLILKQIIPHNFKYLGLLGSMQKIETLFTELKKDGYSEKELQKIFAPIGLNINSKTAQEIAVSIAAEIIKVKNE